MPTPTITYSEEDVKALLWQMVTGKVTEHAIPQSLYFDIAENLRDGLYEGFGGTLLDFTGKDLELLTELRENIYMFSAAKSYQELKYIRSLMFDEDGNLVSAREFSQRGQQAFEQWNETWGRTEFNTAVGQGEMAAKWNEIEANQDILPMLEYSAIGDSCDICKPLDGIIAPVKDPIWRKIAPLNHFNCKCTLLQHDDSVKATPKKERNRIYDDVTSKMDDVFLMNPGINKYVFFPDHPYFNVGLKDKEFAMRNFDLPIPKTDKNMEKEWRKQRNYAII